MTLSPIVQSVTVGPSLTATVTFRADMYCDGVGILAPVASPSYSFDAYSPAGISVINGKTITISNTTIPGRYHLKGIITLTITAVDQGVYKFEFYPLGDQ